MVQRFEEVAHDPRTLLLREFEFLGVRVDPKYVETQSKEAINPTQESTMPPAVRAALEKIFAEELEWLAANGWTWPEVGPSETRRKRSWKPSSSRREGSSIRG